MMRKPDTILDEIHATRRKLYEETKNMSTSERVAYFNQRAESVAKRYGFKIVSSVKEAESQRTALGASVSKS